MIAGMRTRDLLLRGRGADIGARAPQFIIRACGAALGLSTVALAHALGIWYLLPVPEWALYLVGVAVGAVLAPSAIGSLLWVINGALAFMLMLVMYTPVVRPMIAPFIRADGARTNAAPPDAVVVLSGTITDDGRMTGPALDRLLTAMAVAKARRVSELALSVVEVGDEHPPVRSEADQRALVALAAPELSLHFVRDVHSTRDEALGFSALARTHQWRRVIVVTSPMHTRRACAAMEAVGLAVECRPSDGRDYSVRDLSHSEARRLAFQDVLYEVAATALYRARGWMR